ncbi:MAG: alpha/beta fold hydrolase [Pseudomonadota bacterium]
MTKKRAIWVLLVAALASLAPIWAMAEPVQIPGPAGPLEGELLRLETPAHIVIIIPGSGPIDRDGNASQLRLESNTYRLLAEGLQTAGIASIRIDKRGFFGSSAAIANPNDVTIAAYAQDARDWVNKAAETAPCVWLAGHSEGGLVALAMAQDAPDNLCGLLLLSTPGRPLGQLMLKQFRGNPANASLMPELETLIAKLEAGETTDPSEVDVRLRQLFSAGIQRYMVDLFSYDPAALGVQWTGPTLILQGTTDLQVFVEDAETLHRAMPHADLAILDRVTHMLKADVPGNPFATYQNPALPIDPTVLSRITNFVSNSL